MYLRTVPFLILLVFHCELRTVYFIPSVLPVATAAVAATVTVERMRLAGATGLHGTLGFLHIALVLEQHRERGFQRVLIQLVGVEHDQRLGPVERFGHAGVLF